MSLQQVVEELHVELIVLHNHHGLRHSGPSELKRRAISVTAGLAVISLGSVRASHIKKGCGLLGPDASAKTYGGKRIGGSAQQPPRTGNARDCKRKDTGPSRERLSHCAAGRASRSALQRKREVKERLGAGFPPYAKQEPRPA